MCGFGEEEDLFESGKRKKKEIVFESGKRKKKEILCLLHFLF